MRKVLIPAILVLGLGLIGCGSSEAKATKEDENSFRNPSKFPPAGAVPGGAPQAGAPGGPPATGK